jgi:DNA (cytosine-5)-methyltransferase 1
MQDNYIKITSANSKGYEEATEGDSINLEFPESKTRRGRVGKGVAQTLDTVCNQGVICGAIRGRGENNEQTLELNSEEYTNSITTVQKDNVIVKPLQIGQSEKTFAYQNGTILGKEDQEAFCIRAAQPNGVCIDYKIRRLTPRECFRLMDFPDTFIWPVSDSQAYKQAGNSIVVNVLYKILKNLNL